MSRLIHGFQVELQGEYSPKRLRELQAYATTTSWCRVIAVVALTPLPSLLLIMLPETIRLNAPKDGLARNGRFYLRMFVTYLVFGVLVTQQACARLPMLPMTTRRFVVIVVSVAAGIEVTTYLLTTAIGFPLPFTIQVGIIPHVTLLGTAFSISWYKHVRANRLTLIYIADALLILSCQSVLITLYPIYYYVFTNVEAGPIRSAFSLLLPLLKIFARNLLASICRDHDEHTPQTVVFNADIGNALFVSYCMQFNPSLAITALFMAVNLLQALFSLREVNKLLAKLKQLDVEICKARQTQATASMQSVLAVEHDVVARALEILQRYQFLGRPKSTTRATTIVLRRLSISLWSRQVQVVPDPPSLPVGGKAYCSDPDITALVAPTSLSTANRLEKCADMPLLERLERQYVQSVLKLVYLTEFLVLIEYAEVIIPVIYCE
jgi:hypothetical protein